MKIILIALSAIIIILVLVWLRIERSIIPRPSTRAFWNLSPMSFLKKVEGYIYSARPALYLKPATWKWLLTRSAGAESGDTYHGKVLTGKAAAKLITVKGPIELTELEHIIPYPVARDIILKERNQSIAVLQCPCREQKEDACEPREVCLIVGEPFVSFVVDHQPSKARRISVDEALEIIEAEERRGHIHTAWFKDAMHERFYAICNCCRCCCLGMQSFLRGVPRISHSGYRPVIDEDVCASCKVCAMICPFGAIEMDRDNKGSINGDVCMGCGLCATHCTRGAINLELAPDKGVPLEIDSLTASARNRRTVKHNA